MFSRRTILFCVFVILGSSLFEKNCVESPTADDGLSGGDPFFTHYCCRFFSLCNPKVKEDHELADLGLRSQRDGKYDEAIDYFTKAIMLKPSNPRHYRLRGNCLAEMRKWDEAISDFREVLKIVPNDKIDKLVLCRALFDGRKYGEAVKETISLDDVGEIIELADKLISKGEYNEAIRCYTLAIVKNSAEARYFKKRGMCFMSTRNFGGAIADFHRAMLRDPLDEQNRLSLREALFHYGGVNQIEEEILSSLNDTELADLGNKFLDDEKFANALRCFTLAIEKNPSQPQFYRMRGNCFLYFRKFDRAAFDFYLAAQFDPFIEQNRVLLKSALAQVETVTELITGILTSLSCHDLETLAEELFSKTKYAQSIIFYTEAIRKNPREARYYRRRGRCYMRVRNTEMAVSDFRTMMLIDPHDLNNRNFFKNNLRNPEIFSQVSEEMLTFLSDDELATLGNDYFLNSQHEESIRCYSAALQKCPFDIRYYQRRASNYWDLGYYDLAISDLRAVIQIDPDDQENHDALIRKLFSREKFNEIIDVLLVLDDIEKFVNMGRQFSFHKEYSAAVRCYDVVIEKSRFEPKYYVFRGNSYVNLGNLYMAVSDFHQAVELKPFDDHNRTLLTSALFKLGTINETLEETIILLNDTELAKLGEEFLSNIEYNVALAYYTKAIEKNSRQAFYYSRRSVCYQKMNNLEEAMHDMKRAVQIKPSNIQYRVRLIELLSEAEKFEEATRVLNATDVQDSLLDRARLKLEAVMRKQRLAKLIPYAAELIIRDTKRRIAKLQKEIISNAEELQSKISELEAIRDDYLQKLTKVYDEYIVPKIYEKKFSESLRRSFGQAEIPSYFIDKISLDLINDPVITPKGVTYDKLTLKQHLKDSKIDPTNRAKLYENQLIPNKAVKEAIEFWKSRN